MKVRAAKLCNGGGSGGRKWKWTVILLLFIAFAASVAVDIHSIDVEPAMKKEQPDFEDDTGPVGPLSGLRDDNNNNNNNNHGQVDPDNVKHQAIPPPAKASSPSAAAAAAAVAPVPAASEATAKAEDGDQGFTHAFVAALLIIIVSELGDKTFFISAIMAMSHPRLTVFAGAMTALTGMHVMSALSGYVITMIPRVYTFYGSTALFVIFGLKMLREGWYMTADEGREELEEVQSDLRKREDSYSRESLEEGGAGMRSRGARNKVLMVVSRVFVQSFTLNVLAEWGDRSQIATVVLSAREDVNGVIVGGLLGHFLCTGLAVIGGRMIASKISIRTVTLLGGVVFLLFAISALIMGP